MSIHPRLPTLSIPFHTASVTTGSIESPPAFDTAGSYVRLEILEQKTGTMLALTNPSGSGTRGAELEKSHYFSFWIPCRYTGSILPAAGSVKGLQVGSRSVILYAISSTQLWLRKDQRCWTGPTFRIWGYTL